MGSDDSSEVNPSVDKEVVPRHSSRQLKELEIFFKECPHPDENQRCQLSREIGLHPKQIKFWFQNKRTQLKTQKEREINWLLRKENEEIQCENLAIVEALKNVICPTCGGPPFGEAERQQSLQKLQLENAQLKEEHERVSRLLANCIGKPIPQILNYGSTIPTLDFEMNSNNFSGGGVENSIAAFHCSEIINKGLLTEMEKAFMYHTATNALQELTRILEMNEPLWTKSLYHGRYIINRDKYEKMFPRSYHDYRSSSARVESSKESAVVKMNAMELVGMFLDSNKWADLFPTILTDAETIQVLKTGTVENYSGSLQLMYGKMHILSPLVPQREFYFLRYCQQIKVGLWLIVDVSYDYEKKENMVPSHSWKFPSGCMIQDLHNGYSKVTWVEHVKVDDRTKTHHLFRDLICDNSAYGAERWIVALQRMCERITTSISTLEFHTQLQGAVKCDSKIIMVLSGRMVKNFCTSLGMSSARGKNDFLHASELNNSGVRLSIRKSTSEEVGPESAGGIVVTASTSLWLPLSPYQVFHFFKNPNTRVQWDVLSNGNPMHEIAQISTGADEGNCITIYRPLISTTENNNTLVLQESWTDDSLGSAIVYAPIDTPAMDTVMSSGSDELDPSKLTKNNPLLPSGFVISGDGRPPSNVNDNSAATGVGGSLLTVSVQILILIPSSSSQEDINMDCVASINTLISSTIQNIKIALNCST